MNCTDHLSRTAEYAGKIWENGIETCEMSCMKRDASPGSMHDKKKKKKRERNSHKVKDGRISPYILYKRNNGIWETYLQKKYLRVNISKGSKKWINPKIKQVNRKSM